ncbi:MAG TPA: DUF1887 family CARF protein, partial [Anaerolineaceae bacterium]|nr:DUF1887 family CARF protein [Anaerolineaceae bacterium]
GLGFGGIGESGMNLISLVGEQPIPNLLVARAMDYNRQILVHTKFTEKVANNLRTLLPNSECQTIDSPYDIEKAASEIAQWVTQDTVINLTGGTKPMALAAYELARQYQLPVIYLQSEGKVSHLYRYGMSNHQVKLEEIHPLPTVLNISDYFQAFGLKIVSMKMANVQEPVIWKWLQSHTDECLPSIKICDTDLDLDFVIRRGNQVAIVEAKMNGQSKRRKGIDQLNTSAQREYLGTYTGKLWIIDQPPSRLHAQLVKAQNISHVILDRVRPSSSTFDYTEESWNRLGIALDKLLGPQEILHTS